MADVSCCSFRSGCLGTIKNTFTDGREQLWAHFKTSQGQGKTSKFIAVMLSIAAHCTANSGNHKDAQILKKTSSVFEGFCAVSSFYGAFTGDIPAIYNNTVALKNLVAHRKDADICLTKKKIEGGKAVADVCKYTEMARGTRQKVQAVFANVFEWFGNVSKVANSLIFNPVDKIRKLIVDNNGKPLVNLSPAGRKVADAGKYVATVDHVMGVASGISRCAFQHSAFKMAMKTNKGNPDLTEYLFNMHTTKLGILTKGLDVASDITNFVSSALGAAVPAWFGFMLKGASATFSLYNQWIKATPDARRKDPKV